jgi:3-deoxy-D-manno-octulosonate 8-phosphate phosphatase (KDO 8-P phosphatase)
MTNASLPQRCSVIELLVMDVDGVLTDGRIIYSDRGEELKAFHVRDGSALKRWHDAGRRSAILTGRSSPVVARRGAELGITRIVQGAGDKLAALGQLLAELATPAERVGYVGDDWPDLAPLGRCGLACAVADASPEALGVAHYVTRVKGGRGAVREVIELILRHQGAWPA